MTTVEQFLVKHYQASSQINIDKTIKAIWQEMNLGLSQGGCLPMVPTYLTLSRQIVRDDKRILIDAGGTNFRSAVGYFDQDGTAKLEQLNNTNMPGSLAPIDADRFFQEVADNVKHLLPIASHLGYCFSYNVSMNRDIDGTVAHMSKEVEVEGIEGRLVGANTLAQLEAIDGKKRQVVVLNDTVATLLGGYANTQHSQYASYIGYIYGTGTNLCYIEDTANIAKVTDYDKPTMIINMEAGEFNKIPLGEYDQLAIEESSSNSNQFEKITSGRYLAEVIYRCLVGAQQEGLFDDQATIRQFVLSDVSEFLAGEHNNIYIMLGNTANRSIAKEICRDLIDRSAKLGAILNSAVALRVCGDKSLPVAIVAEGSTFKKLVGFRANFVKYLDIILKEHSVAYQIIEGDNFNLIGTLMATMVIEE